MLNMRSDFVVESKGHCFLCLDKTTSQLPCQTSSLSTLKPYHGSDSVGPTTYSLQSLSLNLGMELRKVFQHGAEDLIPPNLIETIKNSKLKGELCEQCVVLNDNFGWLCKKLEKIQMEVLASLNQINNRFLKAKRTSKFEGLRSLPEATYNSVTDWNGKLDILEILRTDAMAKCSHVLSALPPRAKVQNLSIEQITKAVEEIKCAGKLSTDCRNPEYILPKLSEKEHQHGTVIKSPLEHCSASASELPSDHDEDEDHKNYPTGESDALSDISASNPSLTTTNNKNSSTNVGTSNEMNRANTNSPIGISEIEIPQSMLNPETGKYKCSLCAKEFTQGSDFRRHYRAVHINVKYKCTNCGKKFNDRSTYRRHHLSAHVGVRFTCKICGRRFTRKGYLQAHLRGTSCKDGRAPEPKKYICQCRICGKGFTRADGLKRHMKNFHSNSVKHVCGHCGMKFARNDYLLRHQKRKVIYIRNKLLVITFLTACYLYLFDATFIINY